MKKDLDAVTTYSTDCTEQVNDNVSLFAKKEKEKKCRLLFWKGPFGIEWLWAA